MGLPQVHWLGTQKKRVVVLAKEDEGPKYGSGEHGGLRSSLAKSDE